jgi:hypothetical protein
MLELGAAMKREVRKPLVKDRDTPDGRGFSW